MKSSLSDAWRVAIAVCAIVPIACSHSAPSNPPTPAADATQPSPCQAAGACAVKVVIAEEALGRLSNEGMIFKVYRGCPRANGFRSTDGSDGRVPYAITRADGPILPRTNLSVIHVESMRLGKAIAQSREMTIALPAMTGRFATIGIFFRDTPGKYVVADFGESAAPTVTFGYASRNGSVIDARDVDDVNLKNEIRLCR